MIAKLKVLSFRRDVPGKKDPSKSFNFVKFLDTESPDMARFDMLVDDSDIDKLASFQGKDIVAEIFIDGQFTSLGKYKAA